MSKIAWQPYCENCSWAGEKYTVQGTGSDTTVAAMSQKALQELSGHIKTANCITDSAGSWGVSMSLVSGVNAANKPKKEITTPSKLKVTEEPNGGNTATKNNQD